MNLWRSEFPSEAENLACDEALLQRVESTGEAWLRFWTPRAPAVILGYANQAASEANLDTCRDLDVEVHRRISGGGAVYLDPGCLCYSLLLPIAPRTPFAQLATSNRFIMETHRYALQTLTEDAVLSVGTTDLSLNDKKFSGNSQKRGRRALLFHGAILLQTDLQRLNRCLRHPSSEPDWRRNRDHLDFVRNFPASHGDVRAALAAAWSAAAGTEPDLNDEVSRLAEKKYRQDHWRYVR